MLSLFQTIASALMVGTALAAPVDSSQSTNDLVSRADGSITYFNPGLGACGITNSDNDLITAVSAALYDSQKPCGRNIRVTYQGRSVVVQVVDRCVGCAYNDLDLSPAAFQTVIGDLGIGRVNAQWEWA